MIAIFLLDKQKSVEKFLNGYCYKVSNRVWIMTHKSLYHNLMRNFKNRFSSKYRIISFKRIGKKDMKIEIIEKNEIKEIKYTEFLSIISKV